MRAALVAAAAMLAYAAWELAAPAVGQEDETAGGSADAGGGWLATADDVLTEGVDVVKGLVGGWRAPDRYAPMVRAAEAKYGIPGGMLERLLYQESRYREDIISGRKRSSVGALGIAQFMPATAAEMGIDPLDPAQAIDGAGRYLAGLYRQFNDWKMALAAYNWGPGNVKRKGMQAAPLETRLYYSQILAAVGVA
jgi:soluble lytic murein transglycosylase-like protein